MILDLESWMNIRRFRVLHEAGASYAEIARECRVDWRTVKKYLAQDGVALPPPAPSRAGTQPQKIGPFAPLVEGWLRGEIELKASVIHERLVADHGFTGHYQRVKMFCAEVRPRIAAELDDGDENRLRGLHRRFEVIAGAQAQVDWGDEGGLLAHVGIPKVYSFHMTLSYSRQPFTCFTTSMDAATFWECHRRGFDHFDGVPGSIVYDRVKTVVRRHVAPGLAVPLHPVAAAFAAHYGFTIDVLAAYRPTGKGRVERQVIIVRDHVLAGRSFDTIAQCDAAFGGWHAIRLRQVHRTHGEVIGVRAARDRAALTPLPATPFLVTDSHLRRVGKDCLISFEASLYSLPARAIRAGQRVELRAAAGEVTIHATDGTLLASHARASVRGSWVIDPSHYDGLPDGHTRATVIEFPRRQPASPAATDCETPLAALLAHHHAAATPVARRPLTDYATLTRS
jgi:transposase